MQGREMSAGRFMRVRSWVLAGALALETIVGGCVSIPKPPTEKPLMTHSELLEKFGLEDRSFPESDYEKLAHSVYNKLDDLYFDLTHDIGFEDDFHEYAKTLIETGTNLTKYADPIEIVLRKHDIDDELSTIVFLASHEDHPFSAEKESDGKKCEVVTTYSYEMKYIKVYDPSRFDMRKGGHEVPHTITQREDWVNFLGLWGAITSGNKEWLFSALNHLYRAIKYDRFKDASESCNDIVKKKWPQYYKGYLKLVLADNELREYFGMEKIE